MKNYFYITFVLLLITLLSCNKEGKTLKLMKVTEYNSSKISNTAFTKILKVKANIDLDIDYTLSEDIALQKLSDREVDLVIIPNNATSTDMSIKAILPLLPRTLVILTNKNVDDRSLSDILENGIVYFEELSRLDSLFFKKIFNNYNINENKINSLLGTKELNITKKTDSLRVYVGLTHLNNLIVKKLAREGWSFFSLGDVNQFGKGSEVEGFTMMNMSVKPFIIPKSLYRGRPRKPILTVTIYDILISRKDVSNELIYELTKTIIENRSRLIQMNPVYNLLDFNYDRQDLSFPLHKGAIQFLDRNEPPVWSKYIKIIWPLISISVVLFGIIASLRTRFKRRKKQNIEMYYNTLLEIRGKADEAVDVDSLVTLLKELKLLRSEAMKSLANKKLDSGESFNIFLALFNDTKTELIDDIKEIRLKSDKNKT